MYFVPTNHERATELHTVFEFYSRYWDGGRDSGFHMGSREGQVGEGRERK